MTSPQLIPNTITTAIVATLLVVTMTFAPDHFAPPTGLTTAYDPNSAQIWIGRSDLEMDTTDGGEADKAYTTAFWSHFARHHPGTKPLYLGADGPTELPGRPENTAWLAPETQTLHQVDPTAPTYDHAVKSYRRTVIRLRQAAGPGPESGASNTLVVGFDAAKHLELIDIWVIPPNTYTKDTGGALDPAACVRDPTKPTAPPPCRTSRPSGPRGEDFRYVTGHTKLAESDYDHGDEPGAERFIAHYREDGSAVVVRDAVKTKGSKHTPTMSFAALADLALALPQS